MSHDSEAAYASSEIAGLIMKKSGSYFGSIGAGGTWSVYAGREGSHVWPLADGVIQAENTKDKDINIKIAFEYKRPNEGVHGILTALGQSFAYLEKGYDAAVMAFPEAYQSYSSPGPHIKRVIEATAPDIPISIYTYSTPDLSATRPFKGHLTCVRDIDLSACRKISTSSVKATTTGSVSTLWAHMREGMSHPDAFFRYCQAVKIVTSMDQEDEYPALPSELVNAVKALAPGADPYKYLSNTAGDLISDKAWRHVWFNQYFWSEMIPIYKGNGPYVVNNTPTKIVINTAGDHQQLFSGRKDSLKQKIVNGLNSGKLAIADAWKMYAKKVRGDAHSYREVIDSGLFHIGFLDSDGSLTDLGYKYVDACERIGDANSGVPLEILKASVLSNGQYGAMLHYIYKLSEEKFDSNLFAFATLKNGKYVFDSGAYLSWLDDIFTNTLHLSKKSSLRAGGTRKPFQAEISFLKKLGFVRKDGRSARYRVGTGLEIDWPQVQNSMLYFQSLE